MAVDPVGPRVFMIERDLGTENAAVVHVWEYKTSPATIPATLYLLTDARGLPARLGNDGSEHH